MLRFQVTLGALVVASGAARAEPRVWSIAADRDAVHARVSLDPGAGEVALVSLDGDHRVGARAVREVGGDLHLVVLGTESEALRTMVRALPAARVILVDESELLAGALYDARMELAGQAGRLAVVLVTDGSDPRAPDSPPEHLRADMERLLALGPVTILVALPPPTSQDELRLVALTRGAEVARVAHPPDVEVAARAVVRRLGTTYDVEFPLDGRLPLDGMEHGFTVRAGDDESNVVYAALPLVPPPAPPPPPHEASALANVAGDVIVGFLGLVPPVAILLVIVWIIRSHIRSAPRSGLTAEVLPPRRSAGAALLGFAAKAARVVAIFDVVWLVAHAASATPHLVILAAAAGLALVRRRF